MKLRIKITLAACLVASASSAFGTNSYSRDQLIGKWFGSHPAEEGSIVQTISNLNRDGTFEIVFTKFNSACQFEWEFTSKGLWGLSGNIHFTITQQHIAEGEIKPLNPDGIAPYDAYEIVSLSENEIIYEGKSEGRRYKSQRAEAALTSSSCRPFGAGTSASPPPQNIGR